MSAWDEMTVAKNMPGIHNVPYVAGMNVTSLPTTTFSISNSISTCYSITQGHDVPIGSEDYTFISFCPAMTAYHGVGTPGLMPASDKVGGMIIVSMSASDLETPWLRR